MRKPPQRWPLANQVDRRARLLDRIIERLGIEPAAAARRDDGRAIAEARTACLHCPDAQTCEAWLNAARGGLPVPPPSCPNRSFFKRFARTDTGPAAG